MAKLLEMSAPTATQNLLIDHKVPTLQLNMNTEVLVQKNNSNINIFSPKRKTNYVPQFNTTMLEQWDRYQKWEGFQKQGLGLQSMSDREPWQKSSIGMAQSGVLERSSQ